MITFIRRFFLPEARTQLSWRCLLNHTCTLVEYKREHLCALLCGAHHSMSLRHAVFADAALAVPYFPSAIYQLCIGCSSCLLPSASCLIGCSLPTSYFVLRPLVGCSQLSALYFLPTALLAVHFPLHTSYFAL
jgi:hypothetical protein